MEVLIEGFRVQTLSTITDQGFRLSLEDVRTTPMMSLDAEATACSLSVRKTKLEFPHYVWLLDSILRHPKQDTHKTDFTPMIKTDIHRRRTDIQTDSIGIQHI